MKGRHKRHDSARIEDEVGIKFDKLTSNPPRSLQHLEILRALDQVIDQVKAAEEKDFKTIAANARSKINVRAINLAFTEAISHSKSLEGKKRDIIRVLKTHKALNGGGTLEWLRSFNEFKTMIVANNTFAESDPAQCTNLTFNDFKAHLQKLVADYKPDKVPSDFEDLDTYLQTLANAEYMLDHFEEIEAAEQKAAAPAADKKQEKKPAPAVQPKPRHSDGSRTSPSPTGQEQPAAHRSKSRSPSPAEAVKNTSWANAVPTRRSPTGTPLRASPKGDRPVGRNPSAAEAVEAASDTNAVPTRSSPASTSLRAPTGKTSPGNSPKLTGTKSSPAGSPTNASPNLERRPSPLRLHLTVPANPNRATSTTKQATLELPGSIPDSAPVSSAPPKKTQPTVNIPAAQFTQPKDGSGEKKRVAWGTDVVDNSGKPKERTQGPAPKANASAANAQPSEPVDREERLQRRRQSELDAALKNQPTSNRRSHR